MLTQEHLGYSFKNSAEQESKQRAARNGFIEMIDNNGPWELWVSITFPLPPRSLMSAHRTFKQFMRKLNSRGEYLINNFVFCFVLYEMNADGDGVHIHALIRGIHPVNAERFEKRCVALGNAKVAPYRPSIQPNATLYLANKYVSGRIKDFQFMKIDPRKRKNSLMSRRKIQL